MDRYTEPEWHHSALLTIDVQKEFTLPTGGMCIPGTTEVVPAMQRLVTAFRRARRPVVHVVRIYLPDGSNVDLCRRALVEEGAHMATPGSEGSQVVDELLPSPGMRLDTSALLSGSIQAVGEYEWIMYKSRFGAFYRTPLEKHLRGLNVTTLVFAGCNFPNCPRTSIYEASERDFRIVFVEDAMSGVYERGIAELKAIGINVLTADRCIEAIR